MFRKTFCIGLILSLGFSLQILAQCNTAVSLAYFNDFENETVGIPPQCFTSQNVTGNISVAVKNGASAYRGSNYLDISAIPLTKGWVFLPAMNFVSGQRYNLSFYFRMFHNDTYGAGFDIYYGTSPNPASMTKIIVNDQYYGSS
ncbi:MAG: hypothetical protein V4722_25305 [Bacteroidota bacterium]